jgi:hypothetical protein
MAGANGRTVEDVRREIESERERLASAVTELREGIDLRAKLRGKLPLLVVGAIGAGFVVAGGIGATMRLLARRGREGHEQARVGRFSVLKRD